MSLHPDTVRTYDESAEALATYFAGHGPRTDDIVRALDLSGATTDARVVEIGCGNGRDAVDIIPRVGWYEGVDPSEGMLSIARNRSPGASFVLADAKSYSYPKDLDVVFAFASLLHIDRNDIPEVCRKVADSLNSDGIFYISTKERETYSEELQTDQFGERMFYYYNARLLEKLAGAAFSTAYEDHYRLGNTDWLRLALRKI